MTDKVIPSDARFEILSTVGRTEKKGGEGRVRAEYGIITVLNGSQNIRFRNNSTMNARDSGVLMESSASVRTYIHTYVQPSVFRVFRD